MLANIIQYYTTTNDHKKGNKFKEKGKQAAKAEIEQLHNREVFVLIHPKEITQLEKTKAMNSLILKKMEQLKPEHAQMGVSKENLC